MAPLTPLRAQPPLVRRTVSPRPEPGFFLKLFRFISNLAVIQAYLGHFLQAWHWVEPRHAVNTAIAQYKVDQEYAEESEAQMCRKIKLAEKRARRLIATNNPVLFLKKYVWSKPMGEERRQNLRLLKGFNPEYYETYKAQYPVESVDDEVDDEVEAGEPQEEGNNGEDAPVIKEGKAGDGD